MFHCLTDSDWADGNWAKVAVQLGRMMEHPNPSQPNQGPRPSAPPYTSEQKANRLNRQPILLEAKTDLDAITSNRKNQLPTFSFLGADITHFIVLKKTMKHVSSYDP